MKTSFLALLLFMLSFAGATQEKSKPNHAYVAPQGILRWSADKKEVQGFGVNYTAPFAHAYRQAKRMGVDVKQAIKNDIYHFSRMGFDLYRVHVWDVEISDTLGNLLQNEHLDTFDFMINELKQKGINYVLTPIAFWGNGWPEPDEATPGFSQRYGKGECLTDPACIRAQQNYLAQFLNHVNPYTGLAYKNDPSVIAFEVSNEPHHRGKPENVQAFVKGMVDAMKSTGNTKPIFYNITHGVNFMEQYFAAGIQGGTFQWYPTGLGYQRELSGNLIPNVSDYNIPFDDVIEKYNGAKIVYEFDAADVGRSYIYPVMARSFREAGIQIGTHFAYEPTYLAPFNTEYNTHYMNLNFTPQKALSLMICNEIFHQVPMNADFGKYPINTRFGDFMVDYKADLAMYNSTSKFIYTNHTTYAPKDEKKLTRIRGFGSSPVVRYDGSGAYFLDKIGAGLWRLEVMPDAIVVDNPYGRNSPDKTVGVINWMEHTMGVKLTELGTDFSITAINDGNTTKPEVKNSTFKINPGTYILQAATSKLEWQKDQPLGSYPLNAFYAPTTSVNKEWFSHKPIKEASANMPLTIEAQYVNTQQPDKIEVQAYFGWRREAFEMTSTDGYRYSTTIPAEKIKTGFLGYYITVTHGDKTTTYPAGIDKKLSDWDFYDFSNYQIRVVPKSNPIELFDAATDVDVLVRPWRNGLATVATENLNEAEYQVNLERIFEVDNEDPEAVPIHDYSFKHFVIDRLSGRKNDLDGMKQLVVNGRAMNDKPVTIQLAFVLDDGSSFGSTITLEPTVKEYRINLADLKPVKTVTLPRPYPSFLPYYFEHELTGQFDPKRIESIQFSIGPGIPADQLDHRHGVAIRRVWLE